MSPSSSPPGIDGIAGMAKLRNLVKAQAPEIKITLSSSQKTFTTLDKIDGVVHITAPVDTPFSALEVEFVGTSRTFVERLTTAAAVAGRSEAFHQFLKLVQPNLEDHYPENSILRAGRTYDFAFVFAVPQQLLPRICQHQVQNPSVRDAHLQLPPTFGDKDTAENSDALDDLAPDMASVRYGIFARLTKYKLNATNDEMVKISLASKARKLRVIPAADEQPPLVAPDEESDYTMRKEKSIRKGVLKGKLGSLVIEAAQPQSLRIKAPGQTDCEATTMATLMLRFDPLEENSLPPRLGSLNSRLRVATYFAATARHAFPSKHTSILDLSQGMHSETLNLSSRCVANVEWIKHAAGSKGHQETLQRRDSACSTMTSADTPAPSSTYKDKSFYTAHVLVPITLPKTKSFVPTFHSCLISRIYQLKLDLGLHTSGIGGNMELKIPVQVSAEGSVGDAPRRRPSAPLTEQEEELEVYAEDAADFFSPRVLRAPSEGFVGRSRLGSQAPIGDDAPPGYSAFAPTGSGRRTMSVPVY